MENLSTIDPMVWMITASAIIICVLALFAKAIKPLLKLAIIAVMLVFITYYLLQVGLIPPPFSPPAIP